MDRAVLLGPLLPWKPEPVRHELLAAALEPARTPQAVTEVLLTLAVHDSNALRRLAPWFGDEEIEQVRLLTADVDRRGAKVEIVAALTWDEEADPQVLDRALRALLAEQPNRTWLVEVIGWLHDVIARVGGEAAVREVAQAMVDVGRWW
jgi:hypothetical protein